MSSTFASIEKRVDKNGSILAYKTYNKSHGKMVLQHHHRELWALKKLQKINKETSNKNHVICLLGCEETSSCFQLIFPFYPSTLYKHFGKPNADLGREFILQISQGLLFLHDNNIVHCDLSPSNILMDDLSGQMIISDFGCAHSTSDQETEYQEEIGTRYYKAPEHLFGLKVYSTSTDVWSLGAIFAEMLFGYPVFAGESDIEQIGRIVNRLGEPPAEVEREEMSKYPDANKLMFFTCGGSDDEEYEFDSDDEDYSLIKESKVSLTKLIEENSNITESDEQILIGILTWSIKERLTIREIIEISESCMRRLFSVESIW